MSAEAEIPMSATRFTRNSRVRLGVLAGALSLASPLAAQTPSSDPRPLDERLSYFLEARADAVARGSVRDRFDQLPDVLGNATLAFTYYALPRATLTDSFKAFLQSADKARVDQQI